MTKRPLPMPSRRLIIGVATGTLVLAGAGLYFAYLQALRPVATSGAAQEFTVNSGENAPTVAQHLVQAGLLRNRDAFVTYVNFHGLRPRLKAGRYLIAPTQSAPEIAQALAGGRTATKRLTIPEGYRLDQVQAAAAAVGISAADFQAALAAPHTQAFLAGRPAGATLEGFLFPDSYQIDSATTAASLVNAMLDNYGRRVGPAYDQAFAKQGLTPYQGLILASMVEREVSIPADRPIVAQIFLKRFRIGQSLGSDATTEYAAKVLGVPFDVNINSPYNTRRFTGLPPGPIASPGLSSLDAVANPAPTDYTYFLSGKDGKTYFAKTYAEHQQNIAKYLQ